MITHSSPLAVPFGAKGGSSSSSTATEDPNTLQSNAIANIVDVVADGHIQGLVDGWKSVYVNGTPVVSAGGTTNVKGVKLTERVGTIDQDYVPGVDGVESETSVAVAVKNTDPITRTVSNLEADAVRITMQAAQLTTTDSKTGDIHGASVELAIDVQPQGGAWSEVVRDTIDGKTTATYQWAYRVALTGAGPWNVRVRRITADASDSYHVDAITWFSYADIVDGKFSWPGISYYAIQFDAKQFGTSIPSRSYLIRGLIISVPDNYDPITRQYSGIWSGQFKQAWTNNPAWIFYDLLTNTTYGLGLSDVDRYALYTIAKYCDEMVPDGYGGEEPRFTLNTVIASREEAYTVLNNVASAFRGMYFWDGTTISSVQDAPKVSDGSRWFGPSNVIDGKFNYSSTDDTARHNVCCVTWNDPSQQFAQTVEVVEDPVSLSRDNGVWKQTDITAFGCTSRGQARRLGLWTLYSERMETESVSFSVSVADADIRPGDVITVSDPGVVGVRLCGRLAGTYEAGSMRLAVDHIPDDLDKLAAWTVSVMMPDGSSATRNASFDGDGVVIDSPLDGIPVRNAVWILRNSRMSQKLYRVTAVKEGDDSEAMTFAIAAIEYHPNKYVEVENGVHLEELPSSVIPTGPVSPPTGLSVKSYTSLSGDQAIQCLTVSWSKSNDARATGYVISARYPDDVAYRTIGQTSGVSFDMRDIPAGVWNIRVAATSGLGMTSSWALITTTVGNLLMPSAPDRVDVVAGNRSMSLTAVLQNTVVSQTFEFWVSDVALDEGKIESNARRFAEGASVSIDGLSPGKDYFFYVRGTNNHGVSSWLPKQAQTTQNFSEEYAYVTDQLNAPGGPFETITKSARNAAIAEAQKVVPDEVAKASESFTSAFDDFKRLTFTPLSDKVDQQGAAFQTLRDSVTTDLTAQNQQLAVIHATVDTTHAGIMKEANTRATADEALSQRVDTVSASVADTDARVTEEAKARATADEATAGRITQLTADLGKETNARAAQVRDEALARQQEDEALAGRVTAINTRIDTTQANIRDEAQARVTADDALSQRVTQLGSTYDGKISEVTNSVDTMVRKTDAIATDNSQLRTQVNDKIAQQDQQLQSQTTEQIAQNMWLATQRAHSAMANAGVSTETITRATDVVAMAQVVSGVSASVEDLSATVKTDMKAEVDKITNAISAMYTVSVRTVNGRPAVFGITSNGTTSDAGFVVDRFWIANTATGSAVYPFIVTAEGNTMIQTAMIGNGTIGGYLQSDNYSPGNSGWRINKDGSAEFSNATFRGTVHATGGSFKGEIEATTFISRYSNGQPILRAGKLS